VIILYILQLMFVWIDIATSPSSHDRYIANETWKVWFFHIPVLPFLWLIILVFIGKSDDF